MSRLAYFQRTLPDDVPRPAQLPASPPETELSQQLLNGASSSLLNPGHGPADQETPGGRFRRLASSISYHNSPIGNVAREARPVGPRTSRWLVVVLPPQNLLREPAQLGHTMSTSPAGRFNNGILMPLFPTMYGQLTAIAREFGLPSVSGVCIYIHMEGGPSMAPRVSDETWSLLWGHLFDEMAQPNAGLPICGRIEFDVDARKARWYNAWVGVHRGETIEHPIAGSVSGHQRQQSRPSLFGDEDLRSENGLFPLHLTNSVARNTNRPRKPVLKPADILVPKPPTPPSDSAPSQKRLSPVAQEDEPVTAKLIEVDRKIMQWRMTSGTTPNQFSNKTGQISLDPAHMPNTAPGTPNKLTATADDEEDVELNLDDFAWSISSAGPQSYAVSPVHSDSLVLSPDIAFRMLESPPCTPTTATSWGPASYAVSAFDDAYDAHSLDLGHRFSESMPVTPMTGTSWGPGSYAASAVSEYYAASISIGQRMLESQPTTPLTATSWGPGSYPPSPFVEEHITTPGFADMAFDDERPSARRAPRATSVGQLMFPYNVSEVRSARPWNHVWPYTSPSTDDAPTNWTKSWPYNSRSTVETGSADLTWKMVWPYHGVARLRRSAPVKVELPGSSMSYPILASSIYPSVNSLPLAIRLPALYPELDIYPAGYPSSLESIYPAAQSKIIGSVLPIVPFSSYPSLTIYAATYPTFDIYPAPAANELTKPLPLPVDLAISYPSLSVYRAIYPSFDIYPSEFPAFAKEDNTKAVSVKATGSATWRSTQTVSLKAAYPEMDLYPAGYPFNLLNIYSTDATQVPLAAVLVDSARYPFVHGVYRPVYPHLDIYEDTFIEAEASQVVDALPYPFFDGIYPSVYPHNLDRIYAAASPPFDSRFVNCAAEAYPFVNGIYAPVYPWNLESIYAPLTVPVDPRIINCAAEDYPFANGIYAPVYPWNMESIYAPLAAAVDPRFACPPESYPFALGVYPPVYPFNLEAIYSPVKVYSKAAVTIAMEQYPFLIGIYPAVYPHNLDVVYPPALPERQTPTGRGYPFVEIYESQYPYICPYPPITGGSMPSQELHVTRHRRSLSPPLRGHVLRDVSKTHAVRLSHSRRLSILEAPPVPKIPAHIRKSSTSSLTSPVERHPVQRKTHHQLHVAYFTTDRDHTHRKTHAELHARYYVVPIYQRPLPLPKVARLDTLQEEPQPGVPGPYKAAASHSRRMSANLDKLVQQLQKTSPDTPTPTSAGGASGRPVSRLDRSKFPFA